MILLLDLFFDEIASIGLPIFEHLKPGLPEAQIRSVLSTRGLSAPDELIAWYSRFDGPEFAVDEQPFNCFPKFALHSLETAITLFDRDSSAPGLGTEPWEWDPRWLRLGGPVQSMAVQCGPIAEAPVLVRSVGDDRTTQEIRPPYQVVSLCTPLTWWIEGLRAGLYRWDSHSRHWTVNKSAAVDHDRAVTGMI